MASAVLLAMRVICSSKRSRTAGLKVRDIGARDAFLSVHGFDGVPEGYEVHHVVPLSEGGADTPDNMILVSEADHAAITSAHAGFYGWRD